MKLKFFFLLLLSLYIVHSTLYITHATVRYVSKTGTSTPPYTTWQTAADSIQKCINICVDGDTIYVANGTYNESIYVDRTISLIGSSADSTIVDGSGTPGIDIIYFYQNNSTIENFKLISPGQPKNGLGIWKANISAVNCKIDSVARPIYIFSSTVNISKFIITNFSINLDYNAIWEECPANDCYSVYTDNIIISKNLGSDFVVSFGFGGYPTFTNNIVINDVGESWIGIDTYTKGLIFSNNLFANYSSAGVRLYSMQTGIQQAKNNLIMNIIDNGFYSGAISTGTGNLSIIQNNIIKDCTIGIEKYNSSNVRSDYNLFWNVEELISGQEFIGDSNIIADPMFVKDTIPSSNNNYDFHLQAYSPAIDKGNPDILDLDGTRSDIGMYGGPFGKTYTYQDLAPLAPRNLSAIVDSNNITVRWNRNTEADTSFYKVYRDTVLNFTIDSTKLVSSSSDSFFVQSNPHINARYVYKVTCVDNQGNESQPSIELVVNVTGIEDYPQLTTNYLLYQNYPNPFNPSTKIGYQLKERAYVKLMVYDIKGELVSVLVNKEQNAGYYEVEFTTHNQQPTTNNLASGIYLYRIEVIGEGKIPVYTEMKKMLLIK